MFDLTNEIFHDEDRAREWLEAQRWPHGPVCPHCGVINEATLLKGKSTRPGLYKCRACQKPFSATVGTVFERSKIPLHKWLLATVLLTSSKKGFSSHQVHRQLNVTYKTAWFMTHRIRKAMEPRAGGAGPLGGAGKVLESDETFVGGKKKNVHRGKPEPKKHAVHALVERGGKVSANHIADVTAKTLRETLEKTADRKSALHTDDSLANLSVGKDFAEHRTVAHTLGEYVTKDGKAHTQTVESFFALIKRQIYGTHHAISEAHLQRYVTEAAFRWNHRVALGVDDNARAAAAIKAIGGKRLMYGAPRKATNA
jgi:transposase-like protein